MEDYIINAGEIEELQTIKDMQALDLIFDKAKVNIVRGGIVALVRKQLSGETTKFDSFSTLDDLGNYKKQIYKYL
ncbi:MAG: hypothetical protein J0I41_11655 [Filimonas sp.]|nr:hypothetical protein [Filimonas sp.]